MMDLLANLENTTTTNDKPKQSNRKSVVDMMSTLSALQEPPVIENNANLNMQANTAKSLEHEPKRKASFKDIHGLIAKKVYQSKVNCR